MKSDQFSMDVVIIMYDFYDQVLQVLVSGESLSINNTGYHQIRNLIEISNLSILSEVGGGARFQNW